jgi:hypothetical protein
MGGSSVVYQQIVAYEQIAASNTRLLLASIPN